MPQRTALPPGLPCCRGACLLTCDGHVDGLVALVSVCFYVWFRFRVRRDSLKWTLPEVVLMGMAQGPLLPSAATEQGPPSESEGIRGHAVLGVSLPVTRERPADVLNPSQQQRRMGEVRG